MSRSQSVGTTFAQAADTPPTKAQKIFLSLRSRILARELPSDSRLNLRPLAAEYGTGINAASEAVKALAAEGLVALEGKAGARVLARDLERIRGEFILRMAIECEVARRVAVSAASDQLKILQEMAQEADRLFKEGTQLEVCRRTDIRFHLTLATFSGIKQLHDALQPLLDRLVILDQTEDRTDEIPGQKHIEVFEAISSGDPDAAERMMRQHLEHSMSISLALLYD